MNDYLTIGFLIIFVSMAFVLVDELKKEDAESSELSIWMGLLLCVIFWPIYLISLFFKIGEKIK